MEEFVLEQYKVESDPPWHIHHAETAEVAASDGHEYPAGDVHVVVADEDRQLAHVWLEVTEAEERNEEEPKDDGQPHPTWSRLEQQHGHKRHSFLAGPTTWSCETVS